MTKIDLLGMPTPASTTWRLTHAAVSAQEGVKQIKSFEPDTIIAVGGGSAMDAAKIMWLMYEHPEARFEDMAMNFMDIRKRIYTYPTLGNKCYFMAIPTSSGTGSECTPFASHRRETGIKWPSLTTSCCHHGNRGHNKMMSRPRATSDRAWVVRTHALEATFHHGERLHRFARPCVPAPWSSSSGSRYDNPTTSRHATTWQTPHASRAWPSPNAFLGVNNHGVPSWVLTTSHGWANAVILSVSCATSGGASDQDGLLQQYQYPHAKARYAEFGRACGLSREPTTTRCSRTHRWHRGLKARGRQEDHREDGSGQAVLPRHLDEMRRRFNDQCTGAQSALPLISEIESCIWMNTMTVRPRAMRIGERLHRRGASH